MNYESIAKTEVTEPGIPGYLLQEHARRLERGFFSEALSNLHQVAGAIDRLQTGIQGGFYNDAFSIKSQFERIQQLLGFHSGTLTVPGDYKDLVHNSSLAIGRLAPEVTASLASFAAPDSKTLSALFDRVYAHYDRTHEALCELGGLSRLPDGLRVLEYNLQVTGLDQSLYSRVSEIAETLKINPTINTPQEGFGRSIPAEEVRAILSHRGAHLYSLQYHRQTVGFHTLLAERSSLPETLLTALNYIEQNRLLPTTLRIGGCEIFGISKSARFELARAGIRASTVMHEAMIESARAEQLDVLVGVCRLGTQANAAALRSHLQHGWQQVGTIDCGTTPYAVLVQFPDKHYRVQEHLDPFTSQAGVRSATIPTTQPRERIIRELPDRTPFEPSLPAAKFTQALQAQPITAGAAKKFLAQELHPYVDSILPLQCSDGLCLLARIRSVQFAIRQRAPDTDFWRYEALSGNRHGTLNELAPFVLADIKEML